MGMMYRFLGFEVAGFCTTNENVITMVGTAGKIIRSSDGGVNWVEQNSTVKKQLHGVKFFDENLGIAVGDSGTILKTTNGGVEWKLLPWSGVSALGQVYLPSSQSILILGNQTLISSDGGNTWKRLDYIGSVDYAHFSDASNGMIATTGGSIWRTTDGGQSWSLQRSGTNYTFLGVFMRDPLTAYVVGDHGAFLQTRTGGLVSVREVKQTLPMEYSLEQNYPNPIFARSFGNAMTTIGYSIHRQSHVRIFITNLFSQEIQTLVDEAKEAGDYSITFNGSSLPSGIYFIRLETPRGFLVRKMVVMK